MAVADSSSGREHRFLLPGAARAPHHGGGRGRDGGGAAGGGQRTADARAGGTLAAVVACACFLRLIALMDLGDIYFSSSNAGLDVARS